MGFWASDRYTPAAKTLQFLYDILHLIFLRSVLSTQQLEVSPPLLIAIRIYTYYADPDCYQGQRWALDIFFIIRYRWFDNFLPVNRLR
jgi:hypothetical protein